MHHIAVVRCGGLTAAPGWWPQVGAAFVDLESEAAATLAHLAQGDKGSLDIIRQAGAVPKLLAMLSIAVHGVNAHYIPNGVSKAVDVSRPATPSAPVAGSCWEILFWTQHANKIIIYYRET